MPAKNEKMRRLMCLALSMKLGKTAKSKSPQAAKMAKDMSVEQLSDYCKSEPEEE